MTVLVTRHFQVSSLSHTGNTKTKLLTFPRRAGADEGMHVFLLLGCLALQDSVLDQLRSVVIEQRPRGTRGADGGFFGRHTGFVLFFLFNGIFLGYEREGVQGSESI